MDLQGGGCRAAGEGATAGTRGGVTEDAHKGRDAAAPGQKDQVVAVDEWLVVKAAGGAGGLEFVADLDLVEEVGCDKAAGLVPDSEIHGAVLSLCFRCLWRGGGDAVGTAGEHAVDIDKEVDVLPGAERRYRTIDTLKAKGLGRGGLLDDVGHTQLHSAGVDAGDDLLNGESTGGIVDTLARSAECPALPRDAEMFADVLKPVEDLHATPP
jgi:hypothetical protein